MILRYPPKVMGIAQVWALGCCLMRAMPMEVVRDCLFFGGETKEECAKNWKLRKQCDPDKVELDIVRGKVAEWGVWFELYERGIHCVEPDMTRHKNPGSKKKIDAGLETKAFKQDMQTLNAAKVDLHSKSCTMEWNSWTLQVGEGEDGSRQKDRKILQASPKEALALSVVGGIHANGIIDSRVWVAISGIVSCEQLRYGLTLQPPHSEKLQDEKLCIYNYRVQLLPIEERFDWALLQTGIPTPIKRPVTPLAANDGRPF